MSPADGAGLVGEILTAFADAIAPLEALIEEHRAPAAGGKGG